MKSKKLICGIDVSKGKLDTHYNDKDGNTYKLKVDNNAAGFTTLIKKLGRNRTYIMENTAKYSLGLCMKLKKAKADVRAENPLVIKRFIQMNMERNKNDKRDAKWIYTYGLEREATVWQMPSKEKFHCSQILSAIDLYNRQSTALSNYICSRIEQPFILKDLTNILDNQMQNIKNEIKKLETELDVVLEKWQRKQMESLRTIPGLGKRAIANLITYTDGFTKIQNHRQLIALAGLAPREYTSGTSISGKKGICKMGNPQLRKTIYMCSLSAIRFNKPCKEQYKRLKAAGKPSRVALIAVCNKLLKQAFAIATKGVPFDPNYKSAPPLMPFPQSKKTKKQFRKLNPTTA